MKKKYILLGVVITSIVWLAPSFIPTAQAVDVVEGDLIRAIGDIDVWIVKYMGVKKFKRLILNPDVFNMYGHLNWGDIKDIDKSIVDSFTESTLIRAVGDTKVYKLYPAGDTGKRRWIETAEIFLAWGFDWDAVYTINEFDRDSYVTDAPFESSPEGLVPTAPVLEDPGTSISSGNTFTIIWSAPENTTSYTLQRDTSSSFISPTAIYTGSDSTTIDNRTPTTATIYYYRVKATNSNGDSSWSNAVDLQVTTEGVPGAPTLTDPGVSVAAGASFTLSWLAVSNVNVYVLEQDTNSSFSSPTTVTSVDGSTTSYSHTLTPGITTTYYYRIQARNNIGHSSWSNVADMQVTVTVVVAPSAPTFTDPGVSTTEDTHFDLDWTSSFGATAYTLEIANVSNFASVLATHNLGNVTTYDCWHANTGTFYYRVKASNSAGDSGWSNVVNMTVEAAYTVQGAIDAAATGATITVPAGTYYESVTLKQGQTLQGAGAGLTIIDGDGADRVIYAYNITAAHIKDLSVTGGSQGGININPGASQGGTFSIKNCRIYGNGEGMYLMNGVSSGNITIQNNVIYENTYNGVHNSGFRNTYLYSNTITDNGRSGYYDWVGAGTHVFKNNIIVDNAWYGIVPHKNSPRTISYNDVWNNTKGSYYEGYSGDPTSFTPNPGTGELAVDPKFVNAGNDDYHLQDTSSCIDAGDPASAFGNEPAPNGSRINMGAYGNTSGAESKAYTVQGAIDAAATGATITVPAGTYYESVTLKQGQTLQGAGAGLTIIDGDGADRVIYAYNITAAHIKDLSVTGGSQGGININPGASQGGTFSIKNCRIYGNGEGMYLMNGVSSGNITIQNNVIYENTYNGVHNSGFRNTYLYSNTITDNGRSGYYDWVGAGTHVFKNNIIVDNAWYGIVPHKNSPRTISYNDVWNNTKGSYYEGYSGDPTSFTPNPGTGELAVDPKFVNAGNDDYHLQDTSSCIDAGDPASAFGNEPAPNGSRINMGAYGNTSGATTSSGTILGQYAGPDTSSHGVELTNFSVSGNNSVGGTITVQYTYRNTTASTLNFTPYGILVGCRNPSWINKDFGGTGIMTLGAGASYTFTASRIVDAAGTWRFWPAYYVNSSWGPYRWHEITVEVSN